MMKYRKQILVTVFAALLLLFVGDWLLEKTFRGPLADRGFRRHHRVGRATLVADHRRQSVASVCFASGILAGIIHEWFVVTAFMRSACAFGKLDPMNRVTTSLSE